MTVMIFILQLHAYHQGQTSISDPQRSWRKMWSQFYRSNSRRGARMDV